MSLTASQFLNSQPHLSEMNHRAEEFIWADTLTQQFHAIEFDHWLRCEGVTDSKERARIVNQFVSRARLLAEK
jgi:hypothetical protein